MDVPRIVGVHPETQEPIRVAIGPFGPYVKMGSVTQSLDRDDSVVALGVGTRCDENGDENVVAPILTRLGYRIERAKTNTGLGRITNPMEQPVASGVAVP